MGAVSKIKPIEEDNPFKLIRFEFYSDNLSAMFKIIAMLLVAITVTAQACNEAEEFTCGSGECIPSFYRCDKANDGFECGNGECIFFRYECDGEKDCSDGSDE